MKYEKWNLAPMDGDGVARLEDGGYPYLLSLVLASRGVASPEAAVAYLDCDRELTASPFLLRDMDKAVARITRAIAEKETIAVYGDYDVDGITATCLVVDYLQRAGARCLRYIPRRVEDGYGLGQEAILALYEQGARLLVTVDCGITGVEEIDYANSLGLDVVVTDHHECKEQLPRAVAVVDPCRPDCPYPFPHLAGVGVALKLVLALGGESDELFARYSTLAAIGTVADVMRMEGENRTIVRRGLEELPTTDFVGVHALIREAGLSGKPVTAIQIGFVLAPRINAAGRMGAADKAAELLLCTDSAHAADLARQLCDLNRERQAVEAEIFGQAVAQIQALPPESRSALVLASENWHQGVVGIVASRLAEKYACPSLMIHLSGGVGKGSCRSYGGLNLFGALESCSDLLEGFGGHALAAGFTILEKNIPALRARMNDYVRSVWGDALPVSSLEVDAVIDLPARLSIEEIDSLAALEPYGTGNARPVFVLRGVTVDTLQPVGQGKHLKLRLTKGNLKFDGIFFNASLEDCGVTLGSRVDAAFYLQINAFRGAVELQLQMVDIRPSLAASRSEEESLTLLRRLLAGETVSAQEAVHLLPAREQFARLWRELSRRVPADGLTAATLPLLRMLAAATGGNDGFSRTALALHVFSERGLLSMDAGDERLTLALTAAGEKVDLSACPYVRRLEALAISRN
ncbi:MAG: single-stranded-DNA-specific exonuclease RecJ [Oscillospiraceae bacterium]